jgi:signal-transduction protein with cAMP-binding, CBS, and nucleotidyltransferase domain
MLELEFYPKDSIIVKEGTSLDRAFIIIKGEVELKSTTNLYSLSMYAYLILNII